MGETYQEIHNNKNVWQHLILKLSNKNKKQYYVYIFGNVET